MRSGTVSLGITPPLKTLAAIVTVADRLSSAFGRRDEQPNIALAEQIAAQKNTAAAVELFEILDTGN